METCEARDEYPDDSSPVVMEDFVNMKLVETHRSIYEHEIETNLNSTKMVIEKDPDGHDDDEKKTSEKTKKVKKTEVFLRR